MIVETILDQVEGFLHDPDNLVWTRAELLDWLNDGYRELLTRTHALVRPFQLDVPGRYSATATQEWEDHHVNGLFRRWTRPVQNGRLQVCFKWEAEQLEGITPTDSEAATTQAWERASLQEEADWHFRFALTRQHERPMRAYWNGKRLFSTSAKELDQRNTDWWSEVGEPWFFLQGTGREQSFEVFEVVTDYNQAYDLQQYENGCPRYFSGDRTYQVGNGLDRWDYAYSVSADVGMASGLGFRFTIQLDSLSQFSTFQWEADFLNDASTTDTSATPVYTQWWELPYAGSTTVAVNLGVGLARGLSSPDRQYVATAYDSGPQFLGCARWFASSDNSITFWEVVVPHRQLAESDDPDLIPSQLHKFLKFYTLGRAFYRQGEGFRPDLGQHYAALFDLGVGLLATLGTPSFVDRVYAREQASEASVSAPPKVRFPSGYPNPWR